MRTALFLSVALVARLTAAQTETKVFTPYTAQKDTPVVQILATAQQPDSGAVTIHESARIEALMKDYTAKKQPMKGYRVQIFLGERTKAEETRRSFLVKHPDIPAYLSYLAPNFRVRVGDLRSKLDSELLRQRLSTEFPGLYVVPDEIEMPRLPEQ